MEFVIENTGQGHHIVSWRKRRSLGLIVICRTPL